MNECFSALSVGLFYKSKSPDILPIKSYVLFTPNTEKLLLPLGFFLGVYIGGLTCHCVSNFESFPYLFLVIIGFFLLCRALEVAIGGAEKSSHRRKKTYEGRHSKLHGFAISLQTI